MKKIFIALALAVFLSTPAIGNEPDRRQEQSERRQERDQRAERADRAPNPYSNAEQARQRRIRDAIREADRPSRGTYRFKALGERRPDRD